MICDLLISLQIIKRIFTTKTHACTLNVAGKHITLLCDSKNERCVHFQHINSVKIPLIQKIQYFSLMRCIKSILELCNIVRWCSGRFRTHTQFFTFSHSQLIESIGIFGYHVTTCSETQLKHVPRIKSRCQ